MNYDIELLQEVWDSVKDFVPKKDRLDAAQQLVSVFDDHCNMDGVEDDINAFDHSLKVALSSHYDLEPHDEGLE